MSLSSASSSPDSGKPAKTKLLRGQEVSLGCGTLILIALIVAIFSHGTDLQPLTHRLDELDKKIERVEKKLDEMSRKLNK